MIKKNYCWHGMFPGCFCPGMNGTKHFKSSRFSDNNELCMNMHLAFVTVLLKMLFRATICSFFRQVSSNFSDRNLRLIQIPTDMTQTMIIVIRLSTPRMRLAEGDCCCSSVVAAVARWLLVLTAVGGEMVPRAMSVTVTR